MFKDAFSFRRNARAALSRPHDNLAVIDGIRALSIHGVLLYHSFFLVRLFLPAEQFRVFLETTPTFLAWIWNLDKSVDAFFVISGFLIARILLGELQASGDLRLARFYWRRYLRLTPVYVVAILLYAAVVPGDPARLLANLFYVNNFLPISDMAMPWTWSLAVEEQFYLVFPPLLLLAARRKSVATLLVVLLALAVLIPLAVIITDHTLWNVPAVRYFADQALLGHYFDKYYVNLYTRFGPFVSGIVLAWVLSCHADRAKELAARALPFNLLTLAAMGTLSFQLVFHPYVGEMSLLASRTKLVLDRTVFGLALAWIIFACLHPNAFVAPLAAFLRWKIWYPFAQLAYSLYLFHYIVGGVIVANVLMNLKYFGLAGETVPHVWMLASYGLMLVVCVPLCLFLYVTVEKPFMNLRK